MTTGLYSSGASGKRDGGATSDPSGNHTRCVHRTRRQRIRGVYSTRSEPDGCVRGSSHERRARACSQRGKCSGLDDGTRRKRAGIRYSPGGEFTGLHHRSCCERAGHDRPSSKRARDNSPGSEIAGHDGPGRDVARGPWLVDAVAGVRIIPPVHGRDGFDGRRPNGDDGCRNRQRREDSGGLKSAGARAPVVGSVGCTGCEDDGDLAWGGGPLGRRGVSGDGVGCIERGRRPGDEGRNIGILSLMNHGSFT